MAVVLVVVGVGGVGGGGGEAEEQEREEEEGWTRREGGDGSAQSKDVRGGAAPHVGDGGSLSLLRLLSGAAVTWPPLTSLIMRHEDAL